MIKMAKNALLMSSEKGGAGKTTLTVNISAFISHFTEEPVLVVDADLTNQSTTRQLLPSMKADRMGELEERGMLLTTEKMIHGLLKKKTHIIAHDEILHPTDLALALISRKDPLYTHIFQHLPEAIKESFTTVDINDMDISLLAEALATGLTEILYLRDIFRPETLSEKLPENHPALSLDQEIIESLKDTRMDLSVDFRMQINRKVLYEVLPNEFAFDPGLSPAEAFGKLGIRATPISNLAAPTLNIVPSKGCYQISYRYPPTSAMKEMDLINDSLLSTYDHVIYDSEATTNILKSILLRMTHVEMISIVTPGNLLVELDMLQQYRKDIKIRGIIINNALPEHIDEIIEVVKEYNIPLLSIIPLDLENQMPYLLHKNKLVVGTGTNIDYAIRVAALNIINKKPMHPEDIHRIFTKASVVYDDLHNQKTSTPKPTASGGKSAGKKKQATSGTPTGFFSKIKTILNNPIRSTPKQR